MIITRDGYLALWSTLILDLFVFLTSFLKAKECFRWSFGHDALPDCAHGLENVVFDSNFIGSCSESGDFRERATVMCQR
jgi:hypothetical protein